MKNKQTPFYLLTIAIFLGTISPNFLSDGMFNDGLQYAAISNNLAHGIGSFWDLFLTPTLYPHFHEHPPLAFGIQSLFYTVLGDSIYIERLYSLITYFITGLIIILIWNRITKRASHKTAWLPLLFWIIIPLIIWSVSNNMLENTMMIFTSLSVLFTIKSIETNRLLNLVLSGVMLSLAVLTKGLVALFPLTLVFWIFMFDKRLNFKRMVGDSIVLMLSLIIPFLLLFVFIPESYDSLLAYFNKQIIGSITSIQTVDSRFYIVERLFKELLPIIVLVIIIYFITKKEGPIHYKSKWFYILFFLGLSGVLPIMISMKQSGFYILATFPFFSISFAELISPQVNSLVKKINYNSSAWKLFKYSTYTLLIVSIMLNLFFINKIGRDKDKVEDVYAIIEIVTKNTTISCSKSVITEWLLHGYLQRYGNICIDSNHPDVYKYMLVKKNNADKRLSKFKKLPLHLNIYDLYEKKE